MPPAIRLSPFIAVLALGLGVNAECAEIHTAAHEGDLTRVKQLVELDASLVDLPNDRDCRPIHFAADAGSVETVAYLLGLGAGLEHRDVDGDTPLHWAAVRGRLETIVLLLDAGAEIDARNHHDSTPLLYAVMRRQYEAAELLVDRGADIEAANDHGRTPLLWATREGGDIQMVQLLLRLGADVDARDMYGDSSLNLAAWRGFRTLVDIFLDHGARLDVEGEDGEELFGFALEGGLDRLYVALVDAGTTVDVSDDGDGTALHLAAKGGSPLIVRDLLARGAAIDAVDVFGYTPLHYAAARGREAAVEELLGHGADKDARTRSGCSALNLADTGGRDEVSAVLRRHGADPSPRRFPVLDGPYMGEPPPADEPRIFAPDVVASPWGHHGNISFSPDGSEAMWSAYEVTPDSGYVSGTIWTSRRIDGRWTAPQQASFAMERGDDVPFFSPDGQRLFFMSHRPLAPGQRGGSSHIWVVERAGDGWSEPQPLPPIVNDMRQHWQFSVAANGNLYFNSRLGDAATGGLYVSRFEHGQYTAPEFLAIDGSAPFIAPDESYLLFIRFTSEGRHLFITFPTGRGGWSEPIDVTVTIDSRIEGMCPIISPDGKYLFSLRRNRMYWITAGFIEEARKQHGR
jgi:ankyrin repeat protein